MPEFIPKLDKKEEAAASKDNPLRSEFVAGQQEPDVVPNEPSQPPTSDRGAINSGQSTKKSELAAADAKITASPEGSLRLVRTDKPGFEFQINQSPDGSIVYEAKGPKVTDSYSFTIKSDGKGGNIINWQRKDGQHKVFHWEPRSKPEDKDKPEEEAKVKQEESKPLFDNGKGLQIFRQEYTRRSGEKLVWFLTRLSDGQGNKISIDDAGAVYAENKKLDSRLSFTTDAPGYAISCSGSTPEDGIIAESLINGFHSLAREGGITESKTPRGTEITSKKNADGGTSSKIVFTDYPKGGYMSQDLKEEEMIIQENDIAQAEARKEQKKLELTYTNIRFPDEKDPRYPKGFPSGKDFVPLRGGTLNEMLAWARSLKTFPLDPNRKFDLVFLNKKNLEAYSTAAFCESNDNDSRITMNPAAAAQERAIQNAEAYQTFRPLEGLFMHETAHDWTYMLDPKGWNNGSLELELAKVFGFTLSENSTDRVRIWLVDGETTPAGKKIYYQAFGSGDTVQRCDKRGDPVDKDGSPSIKNEFVRDGIEKHARVPLPRAYAHMDPIEAAAEVWVSYAFNEKSRALLMENTRSEEGKVVYAWVEKADQTIINRIWPADKDHPNGRMRLPSGEIVSRTKENEELVAAFSKKYSPK